MQNDNCEVPAAKTNNFADFDTEVRCLIGSCFLFLNVYSIIPHEQAALPDPEIMLHFFSNFWISEVVIRKHTIPIRH